MSDLISRRAAIDALGGNEPVGDPSKMDDDDVVKMWERIRIINIINKLPSAQPEIITCTECKYYDTDTEQCNNDKGLRFIDFSNPERMWCPWQKGGKNEYHNSNCSSRGNDCRCNRLEHSACI